MSLPEIDALTADLYSSISFRDGETPDFGQLKALFYGNGILVNNSFAKPIPFTAESFIQAMEAQVADGNITQFVEREIYAKTDIFGKVAQRISVYEYSFVDIAEGRLPKGINFIQYVQVEGKWRVTSLVWSDENENNIIPGEYLAD
jgi:hypothetical protein